MGRPKVDLARKIGEILGHSEALPEEAATPPSCTIRCRRPEPPGLLGFGVVFAGGWTVE